MPPTEVQLTGCQLALGALAVLRDSPPMDFSAVCPVCRDTRLLSSSCYPRRSCLPS